MEARREVMWRGKGGLSISHFYVGEREPAQGWHAKILTCGLWIFMPIVRLWRTHQCPWSVIRFYVPLLHLQGQGALGGEGAWLNRKTATATRFSQWEAGSGVRLRGHDEVDLQSLLSVWADNGSGCAATVMALRKSDNRYYPKNSERFKTFR